MAFQMTRHRHKPKLYFNHHVLHNTTLNIGFRFHTTNAEDIDIIRVNVWLLNHEWSLTLVHQKGWYWTSND